MNFLEAVLWLTINLYHEANLEPRAAQVAVVHTAMNRAGWDYENVESVILADRQFSWTLDQGNVDEARLAVEQWRVPERMSGLLSVVRSALKVPHYERGQSTHYKALTSASTWGCYPGGVSTVTFPGSGHTFCGRYPGDYYMDVVRPGYAPDYIKKNRIRRLWRESIKKEINGC